MNAKQVEFQQLTKVFPGPHGEQVVAVDNINLVIEAGQMVTLLGPSGCGKTTTLRMLAGFELPTSGRILIGGQDVSRVAPNARNTAMVFQSYALFPHMTVEENIAYGLRFRKVPKAEMARKVESIMKLVGLEGFGKRQPSQLSGGQQQRVALARALVVEPEVLLFDEPLSNLDAKLREQMREEIRKVQQGLGITALYVTHDQSEAMALSDKIVVMNKGRIEQYGDPFEIYSRPANRFVADFIGKVNFLPAAVKGAEGEDTVVEVYGKRFTIPNYRTSITGAATLVCRPEAMYLGDAGLPGRVVRATYLGSLVEYVVALGDNSVTITEANPKPNELKNEGDEVFVRFSEDNLHLLPA